MDPAVSMGAYLIPLCRRPRNLGVTFDTHFTFAPYIAKLNVLKVLAWYLENLVLAYKALVRMLHWFYLQMPQTLPWTPCRSSRTLISGSALAPWRWPIGSTFTGRRDSCLSVSRSPSWALNTWPALFALDIPLTPSSDLPLALESFATPSSPASSPASSSSSRLMTPSLLLRCSASCTYQRKRSAPCPPTGSLGHSSALVSRLPCVTPFTRSAASPACPECGDPNYSVPHLFSCPAFPTDLLVVDLWERPREFATFFIPSLIARLPGASGCISLLLQQWPGALGSSLLTLMPEWTRGGGLLHRTVANIVPGAPTGEGPRSLVWGGTPRLFGGN